MVRLAMVVVAVAFAGCASHKPYVNEVGEEAPEQVRLECRYEVDKSLASARGGFNKSLDSINLFRMCLNVRGYKVRS